MPDNQSSLTTMSFLTHDGISFSCDCGGHGGSLLLFIHGWSCRRSYWQPQLSHFADRWKVAAPDLPGHGQSHAGQRKKWTVAGLARDIKDCIRQLDPDRAIVIGHSMGGAVALEAARITGPTLSAVVLADTFVIDYGGLDPETIQEIALPFETDFASAIAGLIENTSTRATPGPLKERLIREMSAANQAIVLPLWRDLLAWNPGPAFREVQVPVYAINGALIPEAAHKRCAPFVTETVMAGAGHFLQMEDPTGFNRALESLLSRLD